MIDKNNDSKPMDKALEDLQEMEQEYRYEENLEDPEEVEEITDTSDEYYEDMFEEDLAEIEAAEEAEKERLKKKALKKAEQQKQARLLQKRRQEEQNRAYQEKLRQNQIDAKKRQIEAEAEYQKRSKKYENSISATSWQTTNSDKIYETNSKDYESEKEYLKREENRQWDQEEIREQTVYQNLNKSQDDTTQTSQISNQEPVPHSQSVEPTIEPTSHYTSDIVAEADYSHQYEKEREEQRREEEQKEYNESSKTNQNDKNTRGSTSQKFEPQYKSVLEHTQEVAIDIGATMGVAIKEQQDFEQVVHDTKERIVESTTTGFHSIPPEEKPFYDEFGIPSSLSNEVRKKFSDDPVYHTFNDESRTQYIHSAKDMIKTYHHDVGLLNAQLDANRSKLNFLKDNNGSQTEIKEVRDEIKDLFSRVKEMEADKKRLEDFIDNGARTTTHYTSEDLVGTEYSRSHELYKRENESEQADKMFNHKTPIGEKAPIEDTIANNPLFTSSSNLKKINRMRYSAIMDKYGYKAIVGIKHAVKNIANEEEDLNKMEDVYEDTRDFAKMFTSFTYKRKLMHELDKYGIGHKAAIQGLKEMGVIVGVGDVSKMSLKDMYKAMEKNLSKEAMEQLSKAISYKQQLAMSAGQLVEKFVLPEAGEYLYWSKKRIKQALKKPNTDIFKKTPLNAALKYRKIGKYYSVYRNRWTVTRRFSSTILRKLFRNNEDLQKMFELGNDIRLGYRATKTAAKVGKKVTVSTIKTSKKVAKAGVKTTQEVSKHISSMMANRAVINAAPQTGIKSVIKTTSKFARMTSKAVATAKTAAITVFKTTVNFIKATVGSTKALIAACASIPILGGFLFMMIPVILMLVVIMGDEGNGTDVPSLVTHLEDKNTVWVQEIDEVEHQAPQKTDKAGNPIREYTNIGKTFVDTSGNITTKTNNTKEIISMAAGLFQQDFSDEHKVFEYIDEVWGKSHLYEVIEDGPYGCNGEVCLASSDKKGKNKGSRTYYCTEDYNLISYGDCYKIDAANQARIEQDKRSFRFHESVLDMNKYQGIQGIKTTSSPAGYGCAFQTKTYYCNQIGHYNSEEQMRLVDSVGKPYYTIAESGGCKVIHSGEAEGTPHDGCSNYKERLKYRMLIFQTLPKTKETFYFKWNAETSRYECELNGQKYAFKGYGSWSGGQYRNINTIPVWYSAKKDRHMYAISYYSCNEKTCPGHELTTHYCPGHAESVCNGHVDLTVNITVYGFDDNMLFMLAIDSDNGFLWGENLDRIDWAKELAKQNWKEIYDVEISESLFPGEDGMGTTIMPTHPNSLPIPLYNQGDYPNSPYGSSTVAKSGCGITCVAMLASYYKDEPISPAYLGQIFGHYYVRGLGSSWALFQGSADVLKIPYEKQTSSWSEVVAALQDGKPVISIQNGKGPFTSGGHFILLTGITEDGKILVNDPNGWNYRKSNLINGFKDGFTQGTIQIGSDNSYWIYQAKPERAPEQIPAQ